VCKRKTKESKQYLQTGKRKNNKNKIERNNKLSGTQHYEGTKPPTMVIERELSKFLLEPKERK